MDKSVQEAMITIQRNMEIPKGLERLTRQVLELVWREGNRDGFEEAIKMREKYMTEEQLIEREKVSGFGVSKHSTIL